MGAKCNKRLMKLSEQVLCWAMRVEVYKPQKATLDVTKESKEFEIVK